MPPEHVVSKATPFTWRTATPGGIELTAWQLARMAPGSITHPDQLTLPEQSWTVASVPGTVADALQAAGQWDWSAAPTLDEHDWWYRCRFRCDDPKSGASLDFSGLATIADVWLNGTHILSSDNMFVSQTVDTGPALARENDLFIRFASLTTALAAKRSRPRWRTRLVNNQNLRWIRTTLIGRMPGWSSSPQPIGPWKSVTLIPHPTTRVVSRKVGSRLDGADGLVSLAVRVRAAAGATITSASVRVGDIERQAIVRWSGEDFVVHATIRIPDVAIWWPHTHGAQPLYDASIRVTSAESELNLPIGRVGFRTIRLDTPSGDFALLINDERIFWRGACWSPPDSLRLHTTLAEYRRTLELARDAGMNMIRIGGTMVYEHDDFYDLCDELGIMVWQDFMLANMDYPIGDAQFLASVELEARQLLQRIGGHPSLALVCGNSEVEQQAAMLGLPASEWRSTLFADRLPDLVAEHAASVPYWPSSPSGGVLPFHVNAGDGHYFGYGPYLRPLSDVRASNVRFASETLAFSNVPEPRFVDRMACGSAGAGHHPDWKRGVPRDNGSGWDFEDVRDHYVREIFAVDPVAVRYADPERYLALGRVAAGEVMARTIAEWRRSGSTCNGALVWLYRDLRPGAGWGVLDHDGNPKAAYYYLARAFQPLTVVMTDEGLNGVAVHAINDGPLDISAELRASLYRGTMNVASATTRISLASRSTVSLSVDEVIGSFTDVSYAYRFGQPNHDVVVATLVNQATGDIVAEAFHFPLGVGASRPAVNLQARVERIAEDRYAVTFSADELALAVSIETSGWSPSDNYFNVAPGNKRTIILKSAGRSGSMSGRATALNSLSPLLFHAE
jgi:beta-mannosidase